MDQNVDKSIEIKDKLLLFLKKNKGKIIISLCSILILIVCIIIVDIYKERKNNSISEKYVQAGLLLSNNEFENAKLILEEIILSKNKFYSILALNILIEKNLENDKDKVLNYFEIVEKSNKLKTQKELIMFKKALYLLKNSEIKHGEKILNDIADSESNLKSLAEEILSK